MGEPGYFWDDFVQIPFTATESAPYYIGTATLAADPDMVKLQKVVGFILPQGYPALVKNPLNNQPGFTSHDTLLYATQDCLVRFNGENRVQHLIRAGNFYRFRVQIHTIRVVRVAVNGTLDIHAEG